ncbi:MAG: methyltransferase domain-containing protein [Phycisphaerales bacterium]
MLASLAKRQLEPELMDDPHLPERDHDRALAGLARVNVLGQGARVLWPFVRREALAVAGSRRPLIVLDVATGSGDIPVALARWAAAAGLACEWHAMDRSAHALARAVGRAQDAGVTLHPHEGDVTQGVEGKYDLVLSSTFVHHLEEEAAVRALRHMAAACTRRLVICDLRRSTLGLATVWMVSRICSRSPVVHFDALASVRAAFTPAELRALAERAGLASATVHSIWGERMILEWSPPARGAA